MVVRGTVRGSGRHCVWEQEVPCVRGSRRYGAWEQEALMGVGGTLHGNGIRRWVDSRVTWMEDGK